MADYVPLGSRGPFTAAADTTGRNTGNLTNSVTPALFASSVALFEVYHMVVSSVPIGAAAVITVNGNQYSFTQPLSGSEWDPSEPMLLRAGDQVDFLWNVATATTPKPVLTLWLRYDAALAQNQQQVSYGG